MLACLPLGLLFKPLASPKAESQNDQDDEKASGTKPFGPNLDNADKAVSSKK